MRFLGVTFFTFLSYVVLVCCSPANREEISTSRNNFLISPSSDTTVFGPQGTRLFIEKETFQYADGSPAADSIKVELKEFYKKSDIAFAGISVQSSGNLLESAGMIYLNAFSKGQALQIRNDKKIVVHFPKPKKDVRKMKLFYADGANSDSTVTNWKADTVSLLKSVLVYSWWGTFSSDDHDFFYAPKNGQDSDYYKSYVYSPNSYNFSKSTIEEVGPEGVGLQFEIDKNGRIKNSFLKGNLLAKRETVSDKAKSEILTALNNSPELKPCIDKKGNTIEITGIVKLSAEEVPYYQNRKEYLNSFDKKYSGFENQPITKIEDAELNYYIFSVANLGWINCDRFIESKDVIDFMVKGPFSKETQVKMVFSDINGVLMGTQTGDGYIFHKVPTGKQVTILAIENTKGKFRSGFQETSISEKPLEALTLSETTLSKLRKQLEQLK